MIAEPLCAFGWSALSCATAIVLVLCLRRVLRARFGARVAYAVWALVPLAALVFVLPPPMRTAATPLLLAHGVPAIATAPREAASSSFDAGSWLFVAWMLGACIVLLWTALQQYRFVRALGRLSPIAAHGGVEGMAEALRAESSQGCPALVGALRPRIVLPVDFEQRYEPREVRLILAHERVHRARGDAQINALAALLRCVFWFNPLVYFAASRFRFDQELACDAVVISRFPEARRSYADAMLKTQLAVLGLPVGCHWQSSHPLRERIAMLKHPLPGRARRALGFVSAALLVGGGSYAAWAAQPPAARAVAAPAAAASSPEPRERHVVYRSLTPIEYPAAALSAGVEGVVYVAAQVDAGGRVTSARIDHVDRDGAAALEGAALAGVRGATFQPARHEGADVASDVIVPVVFALDPADHSPRTERSELGGIQVSPQRPLADAPPSEDVSYRMMFPPQYPAEAMRTKRSARMMFDVEVDAHGVPQNVRVASSDPPGAERLFAAQSIEAIQKWRFNPAIKEGKPQAGHLEVPIDFRISDDD